VGSLLESERTILRLLEKKIKTWGWSGGLKKGSFECVWCQFSKSFWAGGIKETRLRGKTVEKKGFWGTCKGRGNVGVEKPRRTRYVKKRQRGVLNGETRGLNLLTLRRNRNRNSGDSPSLVVRATGKDFNFGQDRQLVEGGENCSSKNFSRKNDRQPPPRVETAPSKLKMSSGKS